ncbi:Dclre1a [Scenedesmus sp. PABB004]|nr:Dclre1a [Scenedesmus sp. PABB004]
MAAAATAGAAPLACQRAALLALVLVAAGSLAQSSSSESVLAAGGGSPLFVAMVDVRDLPPAPAAAAQPPASLAAALRSAGYPAAPSLSRPPLRRAAEAVPQGASPAEMRPAGAVPVGPGGPSLAPEDLAAAADGGAARAARRRLQQEPGEGGVADGFDAPAARAPAGTLGLAVGPRQLLLAAGGAVSIWELDPATGERARGAPRSFGLSALLAGAAAGCSDVFDPSAAYDGAAGRFLVSATCGGEGRVLLAASATPDAGGRWFAYGLAADGAGAAGLACVSPAEASLADYTRVGVNADGVYVTYKSLCPSRPDRASWGLLVLPKYAVYSGVPHLSYAVYGPAQLASALAAAGLPRGGGCAQLAPALPQGADDAPPGGAAYFVCEQMPAAPAPAAAARTVVVVALLDTGALWHWGGTDSLTSTPLLAATAVQLDAAPAPTAGLLLRQPDGAPPLQQGSRPQGFWNGAFDLNYTQHGNASFAPRLASAAAAGGAVAHTEVRSAAGIGLGIVAGGALAAAAGTLYGGEPCTCYACYWGGQYYKYGGYVGGVLQGSGYGYVGSGYYLDANRMSRCQNTCTRCWYYGYPGNGFGNVGDDIGNVLLNSPRQFRSVNGQLAPGGAAAAAADGPSLDGGPSLVGAAPLPSVPGRPSLGGEELSALFTPCSRAAALGAAVLRQGLVTQGGAAPLGLAHPALAVGPGSGRLLLAFAAAGPGAADAAGTPAYAGVGAAAIAPGASSPSAGVQLVRPGCGSIAPAAPPGAAAAAAEAGGALPGAGAAGWAELSAAGVHAASGRAYTAVRYASDAGPLASTVGTWLSAWPERRAAMPAAEEEQGPYVSKWVVFSASAFIQACAGLSYSFSVYAPTLKDALGLSQTQMASVGSAVNLGGYGAIFSGSVYDALKDQHRLGPRLTVWLADQQPRSNAAGCLCCFCGYLGLYLMVSGAAPNSFPQLLVFAVAAGNSGTWFDTSSLVTNVRNFPNDRGFVVGVLKSFLGLSSSLYTSIYMAYFEPDAAAFLLMLALVPSAVTGVLSFCLNHVPFVEAAEGAAGAGSTESRFLASFLVVAGLALYQMACAVLVGRQALGPGVRGVTVLGMAALLCLAAGLPLRCGGWRAVYAHDYITTPPREGLPDEEPRAGRRRGTGEGGGEPGSPPAACGARGSLVLHGGTAHHRAVASSSGGGSRPGFPVRVAPGSAGGHRSCSPVPAASWGARGRASGGGRGGRRSSLSGRDGEPDDAAEAAPLLAAPGADKPGAGAGGPGCNGVCGPAPGAPEPPPPPPAVGGGLTTLQMVRCLDFWLLFFQFMVASGVCLAYLNNLGQIVTSLGGGHDGQVVFVSLFSVANAAGRLLMGYVPEQALHAAGRPRTAYLTATAALTAASAVALAFARLGHLYAISLLLGAVDLFGLKHFAANYTTLQFAPAAGSYLLASWLTGALYDAAARAHGDPHDCIGPDCFRRAFLLLAGLAAVGAVACAVATARSRRAYAAMAQHLRAVDVAEGHHHAYGGAPAPPRGAEARSSLSGSGGGGAPVVPCRVPARSVSRAEFGRLVVAGQLEPRTGAARGKAAAVALRPLPPRCELATPMPGASESDDDWQAPNSTRAARRVKALGRAGAATPGSGVVSSAAKRRPVSATPRPAKRPSPPAERQEPSALPSAPAGAAAPGGAPGRARDDGPARPAAAQRASPVPGGAARLESGSVGGDDDGNDWLQQELFAADDDLEWGGDEQQWPSRQPSAARDPAPGEPPGGGTDAAGGGQLCPVCGCCLSGVSDTEAGQASHVNACLDAAATQGAPPPRAGALALQVAPDDDEDGVAAWLAGVAASAALPAFRDAEVDLSVLPHLNDHDLQAMGVDDAALRGRILAAATQQQDGGGGGGGSGGSPPGATGSGWSSSSSGASSEDEAGNDDAGDGDWGDVEEPGDGGLLDGTAWGAAKAQPRRAPLAAAAPRSDNAGDNAGRAAAGADGQQSSITGWLQLGRQQEPQGQEGQQHGENPRQPAASAKQQWQALFARPGRVLAPPQPLPERQPRRAQAAIGPGGRLTAAAPGQQLAAARPPAPLPSLNRGRTADLPSWWPAWRRLPGTNIVVDSFGPTSKSLGLGRTWILTHFHADHYMGLGKSFKQGTILCTPATAALARLKLRVPEAALRPLPLGEEVTVEGTRLQFVDANHCPGSAMVVAHPPGGAPPVLHTGDARLSPEVMTAQPALQALVGRAVLVLDTTYADTRYDFPPQAAVLDCVLQRVQAEAFNPRTLFLFGTYTIGKERLFMHVAAALRERVYVSAAKRGVLACLGLPPEQAALLTANHLDARIHVVRPARPRGRRVPMRQVSLAEMESLLVRYKGRYTSVVGFQPTGWAHGGGGGARGGAGISRASASVRPSKRLRRGSVVLYQVPYSEHSSCEELRAFVEWFKPIGIVPSVSNDSGPKLRAMLAALARPGPTVGPMDAFARRAPPPAAREPGEPGGGGRAPAPQAQQAQQAPALLPAPPALLPAPPAALLAQQQHQHQHQQPWEQQPPREQRLQQPPREQRLPPREQQLQQPPREQRLPPREQQLQQPGAALKRQQLPPQRQDQARGGGGWLAAGRQLQLPPQQQPLQQQPQPVQQPQARQQPQPVQQPQARQQPQPHHQPAGRAPQSAGRPVRRLLSSVTGGGEPAWQG